MFIHRLLYSGYCNVFITKSLILLLVQQVKRVFMYLIDYVYTDYSAGDWIMRPPPNMSMPPPHAGPRGDGNADCNGPQMLQAPPPPPPPHHPPMLGHAAYMAASLMPMHAMDPHNNYDHVIQACLFPLFKFIFYSLLNTILKLST